MEIEYIEKKSNIPGQETVGIKWKVKNSSYGAWRYSKLDNELADFHFLAWSMYLWSLSQKYRLVKWIIKKFFNYELQYEYDSSIRRIIIP